MTGGFFGKLFDIDRDCKLNAMEQAMDFMLFDEMMRENESEEELEDEDWELDDYAMDELEWQDQITVMCKNIMNKTSYFQVLYS